MNKTIHNRLLLWHLKEFPQSEINDVEEQQLKPCFHHLVYGLTIRCVAMRAMRMFAPRI